MVEQYNHSYKNTNSNKYFSSPETNCLTSNRIQSSRELIKEWIWVDAFLDRRPHEQAKQADTNFFLSVELLLQPIPQNDRNDELISFVGTKK
jgi:hypothetical protein